LRIRELRIKNFRSLVDVAVPIEKGVTVIIGENNAGKSAFLDALRTALPRGTGRRSIVSDYDFHLNSPTADPKKSPPITVDVVVRESAPNEWPNVIQRELTEVIQTDPIEDIDYIFFRFVAQYDITVKNYEQQTAFCNFSGAPLAGRATSPALQTAFSKYLVLFYLSALRNAAEEFSPRSQFWGQILRSLEIPDAKRQEVEKAMEQLNEELLKADPNLAKVATTLERMHTVIVQGANQQVSIRALPTRAWDLMSKSEIAVRGKGSDVQFPLARHGQGMQSLAVLFLFQAFVQNLLSTSYKTETEAILALEEPEGHLHPQAIRALLDEIHKLGTQVVVTTHSPYFVQNAPLRSIRLIRKNGNASKFCWLKEEFSVDVPSNKNLEAFIAANSPKYSYDRLNGRLRVGGKVEAAEYKKLLTCFTAPPDRATAHPKLKELRVASLCYVDNSTLDGLQNNAQRIRGEIFFARCWLLCEGQCEFRLLHYFAQLMGMPLDPNNVAVIDYQNNGSPEQFVALARAFEFPWFMIADKDSGGDDHVKKVKGIEFEDPDLDKRIVQLPAGDLERFLVENGFSEELISIASALSRADLTTKKRDAALWEDVATILRKHKGEWPLRLVEYLINKKTPSTQIPAIIRNLIESCVKATNA